MIRRHFLRFINIINMTWQFEHSGHKITQTNIIPRSCSHSTTICDRSYILQVLSKGQLGSFTYFQNWFYFQWSYIFLVSQKRCDRKKVEMDLYIAFVRHLNYNICSLKIAHHSWLTFIILYIECAEHNKNTI